MALNKFIHRQCNLNFLHQMFKSIIRSAGSCSSDTKKVCGPPAASKPKQQKKEVAKKEKKIKKKPFKSLWENPECCLDPCPDVLPRYDDLYYRISDKAKKKYQVTWIECPMERKKVPVCCFEEYKLKQPEKRKLRRNKCETVNVCPPKGKCIKIKLDRCKKVRNPPKCKLVRQPTDCCKVCTPYPAFSECISKKPKRPRPVECRCLEKPPQCVIFQLLREGRIDVKKLKFVD